MMNTEHMVYIQYEADILSHRILYKNKQPSYTIPIMVPLIIINYIVCIINDK